MNGESLHRLSSRALSGFYVDLGGGPEDSVFVAGSGRSGTTWLADVVNFSSGGRLIFEPFHPGRVRGFEGFTRRQYLRPGDRREELVEPVRKILSGEVRDPWLDRFHRTFVARRRVVKDVRANLLLGWLRENFPEMPTVLILRHPCAVVESQIALGWKDILDETLRQGDLVEDHLKPTQDRISAARDPFERRVFLWCIENYVPLKQLAPGKMEVVFYENLLTDTEIELKKLLPRLGLRFDEAYLKRLRRPSPVSRRTPQNSGWSVDGWRSKVSPEHRRRAVEILSLFGLDGIYGEGSLPDPGGVRIVSQAGSGEVG